MASVYDTSSSPYTFRETDEADKERQNSLDLATINAISKVTGSTNPVTPAGAAPAGDAPPTPEQMGVKPAPTGIAGTMRTAMASYAPAQNQTPEGIQDFVNFGSNPMETALRDKAARANMQQLDNPAAAFDVGAGAARENLDINQRNQREGLKDELSRSYGGNASQVQAALHDADQQAILDRRGLNSDLTTGRANAAQQNLGQAIQSALGFAGLGSQEKLTREAQQLQVSEAAKNRASQESMAFAGVAQADRALAQNAMQFGSDLEFRKSEAAAGRTEAELTRAWQAAEAEKARTSQERVAYAGLDLEKAKFQAADANAKKGLDLEAAAQAMAKLGMDKDEAYKYASLAQAKALAEKGLTLEQSAQELTKQGMTAENARYYAGLAQQDRLQTQELQSRIQLAGMQIGSAERLQSAQQTFEAAQADLTRTLQKEMQGKEIETQRTMQRTQQDFESMMADKGYLNAKDIEALKQEFATELQRNGFTQETAMQAAELQARSLEAQSMRVFEAGQADLQRKFTTGERLGSEDFAKSLQGLEAQQQERMATLTSDLNLKTVDRQAAYTRALAEAQQTHEQMLQQTGITADAAGKEADRVFQAAMAREGFSQQQALQATALQHEAAMADKQMGQQYSMFLATQAQDDDHFAQELGIKREELGAQAAQFTKEMDLSTQQLGIQKEQWDQLKQDKNFDRELQLAMTGVQMWNGKDPADLAPFAERLAQTMGTALGMDPARLQAAIKGSLSPDAGANPDGTQTQAQRFAAFERIVDTKASPADGEATKSYAQKIANMYASAPTGVKVTNLRDTLGGANMDAAVAKLKASGTADSVLRNIMDRDAVASGSLGMSSKYEYKGTPEFINYTLYVNLLNNGFTAPLAKEALGNLIGEDKAAAALALEGKKGS